MNVIFTLIFAVSTLLLLHSEPQAFLPAVLSGASTAATLCLSLLASYAFWLGVMKLWEDSGITRGISKLLQPIVGRLFHIKSEESKRTVAMNVASNLLGLGAAATPFGIKAAALLEKEEDERYASSMLFALNASSLQLVPTSVVAMRTALGSAAPANVILPTMLACLCSVACSILLVRVFVRPSNARRNTRHNTRRKSLASERSGQRKPHGRPVGIGANKRGANGV